MREETEINGQRRVFITLGIPLVLILAVISLVVPVPKDNTSGMADTVCIDECNTLYQKDCLSENKYSECIKIDGCNKIVERYCLEGAECFCS